MFTQFFLRARHARTLAAKSGLRWAIARAAHAKDSRQRLRQSLRRLQTRESHLSKRRGGAPGLPIEQLGEPPPSELQPPCRLIRTCKSTRPRRAVRRLSSPFLQRRQLHKRGRRAERPSHRDN